MSNRFPKRIRLLKAKEYDRVYRRGKKRAGRYLQLFFLENDLRHCRFGISVGKKWGNAVKRNMLKRRIREAIRKSKYGVDPGLDIVVHAKLSKDVTHASSYENELLQLLVLIRNWNL